MASPAKQAEVTRPRSQQFKSGEDPAVPSEPLAKKWHSQFEPSGAWALSNALDAGIQCLEFLRGLHILCAEIVTSGSTPENWHEKNWQISPLGSRLPHINAAPDDIPKAAMAYARRTLESAADFTRRGRLPAPDHDADYACRASRLEEEQRLLIEWARENGKLGPRRLPPVFARGGEH